MKKIIPFLIIIFLIFSTCKEKEPTAPEEEIPTSGALAEATIGAEGGTISSDEITLTIPSGALENNNNIKIFKTNQESNFNNSVTNIYLIEGIDSDFQKPLHISIKFFSSIEDESYIAVGAEALSSEQVEPNLTYFYQSAKDSAGYLTCAIPAPNSQGLGKLILKGTQYQDEKGTLHLEGLSGIVSSKSQHFKIIDNKDLLFSEDKSNILKSFESAYQLYKSMDFKFEDTRNWPMIIDVRESEEVRVSIEYRNNNNSQIVISNTSNTDETIGAVFFQYVAKQYDNRYWIQKQISAPDQRWFTHAVVTWSKGKLFSLDNPSDTYKNEEWKEFEAEPFESFHTIGANAAKHGRGMAPFVEWVGNKYGEAKILEIYKKIRDGKHVIRAIIDVIPDPLEIWIDKFYRDYFYNEIKGYLFNYFLSLDYHYRFVPGSSTLTPANKLFSYSYSNLCTKVFYLNTGWLPPGINYKITLNISGEDKSQISASYYINEKLYVIEPKTDEIILNSIDFDGYFEIFVTNVNNQAPHHEEMPIDLNIDIESPPQVTGCSVFLRNLTADFTKEYPIGTFSTVSGADLSMGFPKDKPDAEVTFSGRILTQKYTNYQFTDGYNYSGDISITFGEKDGKIDMDYISSVTAKWERAKEPGSIIDYYKNELSAAIVIEKDKSVDYLRFRISGNKLCENIQSLYNYEGYRTWNETLIGGSWECNEDSELEIYVSTQ